MRAIKHQPDCHFELSYNSLINWLERYFDDTQKPHGMYFTKREKRLKESFCEQARLRRRISVFKQAQ